MNKITNSISARLSLRKPQQESLEILSDICGILQPGLKEQFTLEEQLEKIKSLYSSVLDFERDFPSLCFALATGVGKTRLMGAFISYLYITKKSRNFFVLAPNLTIYNKLIEDFTPNTSKYVFKGITEFATNQPVIITGDNYDNGLRINSLFRDDEIHINIFNISKMNSEVRGGKSPKIKRLSEFIGESYFEYLSNLSDLVLIMDESHRYRASAGVRVLNELKPVLGLELTATPQIEVGNSTIPFKNVIYSYPMYKAMEDGFVKEPAVATRENFNPDNYSTEELEEIKLRDGITIHEETKVELEVYARQFNQPIVKPFVLIIAQDTVHAQSLLSFIQSPDFYGEKYKNKVITIHSNQRGEEKDETIQELMNLEDPNSETEIVIHVNMLKEGWDVNNLYTIIPLRAANSKTLVEQSIGRGLRLPYGKRTGIKAVDRLTIVAHERFQDIIDEANKPTSIIRNGVIIGKDVGREVKKVGASTPLLNQIINNEVKVQIEGSENLANSGIKDQQITEVINLVQDKLKKLEYLPNSKALNNEKIKNDIFKDVREKVMYSQLELFPEQTDDLINKIVNIYVENTIEHTIDIPKIMVQPVGEVTWGFRDFDLVTNSIHLQPVEENILLQYLQTSEREVLKNKEEISGDNSLEDYLVDALIEFPEISYEDHSDLIYKLTSQMISHLRGYLEDDSAVRNVTLYNKGRLVHIIYAQMKDHYFEDVSSFKVVVTKGFESLEAIHYTTDIQEEVRNFRVPLEDKSKIRSMIFGGFLKSLYAEQKFDSDSERRFAVICENDPDVQKWFKPALGQLKIYYGYNSAYNPDFVVETKTHKFICEIKSEREIDDKIVQDKARAVREWCKYASDHEKEIDGKPWKYLLIPHTDVQENMTLQGLLIRYEYK